MAGTAGRVLVADDDMSTRRSLERGLRLAGFEVTPADDGRAAWQSPAAQRPDIVVPDICIFCTSGMKGMRFEDMSSTRTNTMLGFSAAAAWEDAAEEVAAC